MRKAINIVTLFLFSQLFLSFAFAELPSSEYFASLSLLLPLVWFCVPFVKKSECAKISFDIRAALPYLLLFPLFLLAVIITSSLTAAVSSFVGYTPTPVVPTGSGLEIIVFSVILPAISEELFCRWAALRLLSPYSTRGAVVVSALLFAVMHGNFYQMPYAFVAGLALGVITLASGSLMTAVFFHALNNLVSVFLYYLGDSAAFALLTVLAVATPVCLVIFYRRGGLARIRLVLSGAGVRAMLIAVFSSLALLYIIFMLAFAI